MHVNEIRQTEEGYEAIATLTIKDIRQEVRIFFTTKEENGRQILEERLDLQRKDCKPASKIGEMIIGLDVKVFICVEILIQ